MEKHICEPGKWHFLASASLIEVHLCCRGPVAAGGPVMDPGLDWFLLSKSGCDSSCLFLGAVKPCRNLVENLVG